MHSTPPEWQRTVYDVLKRHQVRQLAYVPDAGHAYAIQQASADPDVTDIVLTTEEEGVALVGGAWLGGDRAALLMQSSGVGNCLNMFSLLQAGQFPFLALVTMRGEFAEFNPWQAPMGRATAAALELMGIQVQRVDDPARVASTVDAAAHAAFEAGDRVAVLLGQRLIGRKRWER